MKHENIAFDQLAGSSRASTWDEDAGVSTTDTWPPIPKDTVVIYQTPDRRTARQRLITWWRRRWLVVPDAAHDTPIETSQEPVWESHWALTKYL